MSALNAEHFHDEGVAYMRIVYFAVSQLIITAIDIYRVKGASRAASTMAATK